MNYRNETPFRSVFLRTAIPLLTFFLAIFFAGMVGEVAAQELPKNENPILKFFGMGSSPLTTVAPANSLGREVNDLYALITYVTGAIVLLVFGIFAFVAVKFREKANTESKDSHGSFFMEMAWTIAPIIIVIIFAVPTIQLTFKIAKQPDLHASETIPYDYIGPDGAIEKQEFDRYLEITVVGHQWWWEFEYEGYYVRKPGSQEPKFQPINRTNGNEPWLPVGVPIKMNITSEDVIHSIWLPQLSGKLDVVPGHVNQRTFVIEKEGYYWGQCAEYCGASHALMRFHVVAVSQEKFKEWLKFGKGEIVEAKSESAKRGKTLFGACLGCHTMDGYRPFISRNERINLDQAVYLEEVDTYNKELAEWKLKMHEEHPEIHHKRDLLKHPFRPSAPRKPEKYIGDYKTIAPDLTDLRFRKKILAGIKANTRENLRAWIEDPPAIKPEISGTVVQRMPAYKDIFSRQQIDDIIEFLMTVTYTESGPVENLATEVNRLTSVQGIN